MGVLIVKRSVAEEGSNITPAVTLEYTDTSGVVRQTNVVDGVTSITGRAPFIVKIDAGGTRSVATDGDDAAGAFLNVGYHVAYGEGLGTTWLYPEGFNYSMDEDFGPPVYLRAFTHVGTNTVVVTCKDSLNNEADISFDVVVQEPTTALTTVNIPVAAGSWGTLTSERCYTIDRGGDYSSFGIPNTNGLFEVIFKATGSGADPIIAGLTPDSRNNFSSGTRARGIRTHGVDVKNFTYGAVGCDYSGVIDGRCRGMEIAPHYFYFDNLTPFAEATANSIRYARGILMQANGAVMNNPNAQYMFIGAALGFAVVGYDMHKNANSGEHIHRGQFGDAPFRYNRIYSTVATTTWTKMNGLEVYGYTNGSAVDDWTAHDCRVGDYATAVAHGQVNGKLGYPGYRWFYHCCQFGASGDTNAGGIAGPEPQNNTLGEGDVGQTLYEGLILCGFEDCVSYRNGPASTDDVVHSAGQNLFVRNFRRNQGAGTYISSSRHNENKIPPGLEGPYIDQTTNTRPVPSTL